MKSNPAIDDIDRRILKELQVDALLSHAELAERVGSSPASCWRRVKALENAGILGPAVRLLDAGKIDLGVNVLCNVRMRSHDRASIEGFENFVASRTEIMDCYSMSGDWDYLLRIVAVDVAGYEHFLMRILLGHPSVATASSHFALSQTKYSTRLPV